LRSQDIGRRMAFSAVIVPWAGPLGPALLFFLWPFPCLLLATGPFVDSPSTNLARTETSEAALSWPFLLFPCPSLPGRRAIFGEIAKPAFFGAPSLAGASRGGGGCPSGVGPLWAISARFLSAGALAGFRWPLGRFSKRGALFRVLNGVFGVRSRFAGPRSLPAPSNAAFRGNTQKTRPQASGKDSQFSREISWQTRFLFENSFRSVEKIFPHLWRDFGNRGYGHFRACPEC